MVMKMWSTWEKENDKETLGKRIKLWTTSVQSPKEVKFMALFLMFQTLCFISSFLMPRACNLSPIY